MRTYVCDYATVSPVVLVNAIINDDIFVNAWADFYDVDEDVFVLRVYPVFGEENVDLTAEEWRLVENLVKPYLAKQGLTNPQICGTIISEREKTTELVHEVDEPSAVGTRRKPREALIHKRRGVIYEKPTAVN